MLQVFLHEICTPERPLGFFGGSGLLRLSGGFLRRGLAQSRSDGKSGSGRRRGGGCGSGGRYAEGRRRHVFTKGVLDVYALLIQLVGPKLHRVNFAVVLTPEGIRGQLLVPPAPTESERRKRVVHLGST